MFGLSKGTTDEMNLRETVLLEWPTGHGPGGSVMSVSRWKGQGLVNFQSGAGVPGNSC